MFNEVKPLDGAGEEQDGIDLPDISLFSTTELLLLRSKIDQLLPPMELSKMNLEQELVRQYQTVLALQSDTIAEERTDAAKKAAVVNATAASLQHLVKLQTDLFTAERFKAIESLLIKHLKLLPKETVEAFMKQYSQLSEANK